MQNKLFATMITALLVLLMAGTAMCATYDSNVTLENKDGNPDWNEVPDGISALIEYNSVGEEFAWYASGNATLPNTEYSLIYYADYPDRFNMYGGDNPGALIGTMMTEADGTFDEHGYTELGMNLPHADDANANVSEYDYCGEPDEYDHCTGAKLWMVPSDYYDASAKKVTNWEHQDDFLFETDLIEYEDCGLPPQDVIPTATFVIGDVFGSDTVPIMILDATNAGSVDMTLTYDPAVVSVSDVTDGNMDSMFYNNDIGYVRIGAYQMNSAGLDGDFVLANVEFTNVGDEPCDFNITVTTYKDATPCGRSMPYDVSVGGYCSYQNGDANGDGDVDMFDAMYIAKYKVGISGFENIIACAADVDGTAPIDLADASYLAKHILGGFTGYEELK